jgi:hypothetical protein
MEDHVHAARQLADERRVADVALDDLDVAVGQRPREVLAAAADEVVEDDDLARLCTRSPRMFVSQAMPSQRAATARSSALRSSRTAQAVERAPTDGSPSP